MNIPRIRARTGQGDDGKWYFEFSLWNFEATKMIGEPFGSFGPWETEAEAKVEMRRCVEIACKAIKVDGQEPTGYVDFKNGGVFRKFEEH